MEAHCPVEHKCTHAQSCTHVQFHIGPQGTNSRVELPFHIPPISSTYRLVVLGRDNFHSIWIPDH